MVAHACHALPLLLLLLMRVALLPSSTIIAPEGSVSMIDSLSPHHIGSLIELCIEAGELAQNGLESRCAHCSLTQIHAASVRGPCAHAEHKNAAARISALPISRGRAFVSPA